VSCSYAAGKITMLCQEQHKAVDFQHIQHRAYTSLVAHAPLFLLLYGTSNMMKGHQNHQWLAPMLPCTLFPMLTS
jgi:hypothetical protein